MFNGQSYEWTDEQKDGHVFSLYLNYDKEREFASGSERVNRFTD